MILSVPGLDDSQGTDRAGDLDATALDRTLSDLMPDLQPGEFVDVFVAAAEPLNGHTALAHAQLRWHAPTADLGAALAALQPDAAADVAWLRAGMRMRPGWRHLLRQTLSFDAHLGSVSPLVLEDEWLSPLRPEHHRKGFPQPPQIEAIGQWLSDHASAEPMTIDGPSVHAGVLRGPVAARVARRLPAAAEGERANRWASEVEALGLSHGLSLRVLVHGARSECEPPRSSLLAARELWRAAHPLTGLRHAVAEIRQQLEAVAHPPTPPAPAPTRAAASPVRLHVSHSWGGGLAKWVRDFNRADHQSGRGTGLVLRSVGVFGAFGQRLTLHVGDEDVAPVRFWELGVPIHATAPSHTEVRAILREIIEDFGVEQVLVSSLIGHSLDVMRTGLPTLMVAHDHHPFCVALYASFGGECRSCDRQRLDHCLRQNPEHRFFQGVNATDWMALREAFVDTVTQANLPIAAPSRSVAERWQSMMPALDPRQFRVIEHGLNLPAAPPFDPPEQGPLRVLVLGRLSPEKGSTLLRAMLPDLLEFCELLLVGCGDRVDSALKDPRVTIVADFNNPALPQTLAALRPHVGLLMSTVPETFSYTLSEMWHCGIPVVATAHGALADRIEQGLTGFAEPADAWALLQRLRLLAANRDLLSSMRLRLLSQTTRTVEQMVKDYDALLVRSGGRGNTTAVHTSHAMQAMPDASSDAERSQGIGGRRKPPHLSALHVNPEVTWRQAAAAFWQFTCLKASRSPRVPPSMQRWFARRLQ